MRRALAVVALALLSSGAASQEQQQHQWRLTEQRTKVEQEASESIGQQVATRFKRLAMSLQANEDKRPQFGAPIGNVSASLGRDVRLVCTVDNLGQHQVAWLKEETKTILSIDTNIIITNYRIFLIPDEEGRKWVLHIKDVQEADRGFYRCQVNTSPMISTLGYLEVVVPANFVETETSQVAEVLEHANVSLQCKANGHPRPAISWRRDDGEPIKLTGSGREPTAQVSKNHADETMGPAEGDEIRKRAVGELNPHLNDVRGDKLVLTNVDRTMAGLYVCSASNGVPGQVSRKIPLYVKFPPKVTIVQRPAGVAVALGDQFELECLIEAFPKPTSYWSGRQADVRGLARARWLLDPGAAPLQRHKHDSKLQSLVTPPGGVTARVHLLQESLILGANQSADESAESQAHDSIRLAQLKQQHEAPPSERQQTFVTVKQSAVNSYTYRLRLSVARVRPSDLGDYVCIASNSLGTSSARVQVRAKSERFPASFQQEPETLAEFQHGAQPVELWDGGGGGLSGASSNQLFQTSARQVSEQPEMLMGRPRPHNLARQTNRVYDENYLQAIRNRQAASPVGNNQMTQAGRLQQKLKLIPNGSDQARNLATKLPSSPSCWLACALATAATLVHFKGLRLVAATNETL